MRCVHVFLPRRYFLLCVNYFFYGETVTDYFFTLVQREEPLRILSKYHRFISFALYLTGTNTKRVQLTIKCVRSFTLSGITVCYESSQSVIQQDTSSCQTGCGEDGSTLSVPALSPLKATLKLGFLELCLSRKAVKMLCLRVAHITHICSVWIWNAEYLFHLSKLSSSFFL